MDAARGVAVNIRTAAEARMLEAKDAGRVGKRMKRLVRYIKKGFIKTGSILRWAVTNPESSKIDMVALAASSQVDVSPMVLAAEIMTTDPKLKILPFTPLMEDITVRRQQLLELMDRISRLPPEFIANIVPEEFVKEVFDVFHQRPSIMKDSATMEEEQLAAQEAAMAPAPPNVAPDMGLPQPSIPVALPPLVR
jgi:hypothetical protein